MRFQISFIFQSSVLKAQEDEILIQQDELAAAVRCFQIIYLSNHWHVNKLIYCKLVITHGRVHIENGLVHLTFG